MGMPAGNASRILQDLREGPRTAQALAGRLGLDVSSVRRHLDALRARAWLQYEDIVEGPGRPKRHYMLTEAGRESFPRDYAFLLDALLDKLQGRMGRDALLGSFSEIAADLAAGVPMDRPMSARLEALRRLYVDLGFEASIEQRQDGACLVQRNCPFLKTATSDPEGLCACLDEGIMRNVLPEATVELGECMATGDGRCTHIITTGPASGHAHDQGA